MTAFNSALILSTNSCKRQSPRARVGTNHIQRYLRAVEQHDYGEVIACFADDAVVVHPIFGRQPAAGFLQTLFAKTWSTS